MLRKGGFVHLGRRSVRGCVFLQLCSCFLHDGYLYILQIHWLFSRSLPLRFYDQPSFVKRGHYLVHQHLQSVDDNRKLGCRVVPKGFCKKEANTKRLSWKENAWTAGRQILFHFNKNIMIQSNGRWIKMHWRYPASRHFTVVTTRKERFSLATKRERLHKPCIFISFWLKVRKIPQVKAGWSRPMNLPWFQGCQSSGW